MAAAERPQLFLRLGDRLRREVEGDFGQMQPVALGIEFDPHRQAAAKGDIGTGGFHLHADVPPVAAVCASPAVFVLGVAEVRREEPPASVPVPTIVADRAGFPSPGKPADAAYAAAHQPSSSLTTAATRSNPSCCQRACREPWRFSAQAKPVAAHFKSRAIRHLKQDSAWRAPNP